MVNRKNRKTEGIAGYSLIETLFAVFILSVGAFGLLAACYSSLDLEGKTVRQADCERVAGYAYATFKSQCARNGGFLKDCAESGAFPGGDGLGEYPSNKNYRWSILVNTHNETPGLFEITVQVFDKDVEKISANPLTREDDAAYAFHTFISERE